MSRVERLTRFAAQPCFAYDEGIGHVMARLTHRSSAMPQKVLQNLLFAAIAAWGLYLTQGVMGDARPQAQASVQSMVLLSLR